MTDFPNYTDEESSEYPDQEGESNANSLVDGGWEAWKVLLAAWIVDFMTSGVAVSFGLFQSSYLRNPLLASTGSSIAAIGALLNGISWLATPFTNALVLRYVNHRIQLLWLGWLLCIFGLLGASFATRVWHLYIFQGIMYGAGWVLYWSPVQFIMHEWWVKRRGLAYGIWFTASNASGLVMPFAIQRGLEMYGFRTTLRTYAFVSVIIAGPALFMIRPRRRPQRKIIASLEQKDERKGLKLVPPLHILKNPHFLLFTIAIMLQSFVNIIPNLYLPSFATSLSLPPSRGSQLLALSSIACIAGQMSFGYISDAFHPYTLTSFSTLICSIAAFGVQGARGSGALAVFAIAWGACSGSYDVLFTRICAVLTQDPDESLILYGFLSFERGIAVLAEGLVASTLVDEGLEGYPKYVDLLRLCSWCMLVSALCGIGWFRRGK